MVYLNGMKKGDLMRPQLRVEFDREEDGRWIAEVPQLPGVMAYGATKSEALKRAYAIALRAIADHLEDPRLPRTKERFLGYGVARR